MSKYDNIGEMKYQVSENVIRKLAATTEDTKVLKALQFIEDEQDFILERQIELTLIPAPTHHEEKKARRILELYKEQGLEDCHIDPYGNVVGIRRGTGGGKTVLVEAHMDTVFPMDTKLEVVKEDGWVKCPGILDNTRGCAAVLSVMRALNAADIKTKGDIHFVGTVQEEGTGALKGMQYYVQHHPELDASITIDGDGFQDIVYEATGIQTYEVIFHGIGGHASGAFAQVANPIHAAARAITKIGDIREAEFPHSTYEVTNLLAGTYEAVHAIPAEATIRLNFRSNDQEELMKLRDRILGAIDEACKEETARWGKDTITYTVDAICDVNAGTQDPHTPIVEGAMAIAKYLGCENPRLEEGGSTNFSRAIEAGLPSVCLGEGSGYSGLCHTTAERFRPEGAFRGCQAAMLLALLCAGNGDVDSVFDK